MSLRDARKSPRNANSGMKHTDSTTTEIGAPISSLCSGSWRLRLKQAAPQSGVGLNELFALTDRRRSLLLITITAQSS